MPIPPRRPVELVGKIFRGSDAVAAGLLTRADLRSTAWRRLFQGVYADARMTVTHQLRCLAALRYLSPPTGVLAGASAAHLHGGLDAGALDDVVLLVPPDGRVVSSRGIRLRIDRLAPADIQLKGRDLRVTSPERTCWDLARWGDVVEAVVVIDALLASRATTVARLLAYSASRADDRGWRRFARACELMDGGSESPPESRTRVRLMLAGVPKPVTQHVIRHNGRFVARVDLAWPELKVAVEYDGAWHDSAGQFDKDRARLNRVQADGWLVLHLTAARLRDDFEGFATEVNAALRARDRIRSRLHSR